MILHIGNGRTVRTTDIVGIFDLDNATVVKESRSFLSTATKKGEVSYADSDIPRAFLVVSKKPVARKPSPTGEGGRARAVTDEAFPSAGNFAINGGTPGRSSPTENNPTPFFVGEGSPLPHPPAGASLPCVRGGVTAGDGGVVTAPRRRHPARRGGKRTPPPVQTVLLSHISSAALHARCDRPLLEEE